MGNTVVPVWAVFKLNLILMVEFHFLKNFFCVNPLWIFQVAYEKIYWRRSIERGRIVDGKAGLKVNAMHDRSGVGLGLGGQSRGFWSGGPGGVWVRNPLRELAMRFCYNRGVGFDGVGVGQRGCGVKEEVPRQVTNPRNQYMHTDMRVLQRAPHLPCIPCIVP